jgi:hypothetical protein
MLDETRLTSSHSSREATWPAPQSQAPASLAELYRHSSFFKPRPPSQARVTLIGGVTRRYFEKSDRTRFRVGNEAHIVVRSSPTVRARNLLAGSAGVSKTRALCSNHDVCVPCTRSQR